MTQLAFIAWIALAAPALPNQETPRAVPIVNGDFEEHELVGWFIPEVSKQQGFAASVSGDDPWQGRNCALLEYTRTERPEAFGNLIQSLAAKDLRGKRVRLRTAVRTEGKGHAQLWLRTDGQDGFSLLLDNMHDRPIQSRTGEWATYDIVGDVDPRTDILVLGMMLFEGGRAFLDEVSVTVLGETSHLLAPPRALEPRARENLVAFTRLFGYVRHFHPSDQALEAGWERAAVSGASAIESAADGAELTLRLQEFFAPIAPTVQVFASSAPPARHPALQQPTDAQAKLLRWRNHGFGSDGGRGNIYRRRRDSQRLRDGKPREGWTLPEDAYEAELVPGVSCRVPTVLWSDAEGTLPHGEVPPGWGAPPEAFLASGDDRAARLADVILAWNVFQHFYPYFDVTEVDWPKELERALTAAATDADARAFLGTLQRMVAALRDGHGYVGHPSAWKQAALGVCWGWVEDQLVILAPSAEGALAPGDVVTRIDGVVTQEAFRAGAALLSAATPQFLRYQSLSALGSGDISTAVRLEVRSPAGETRALELGRGKEIPAEPRPEKIAELEPSIWYVDLDRIEQADFEGALEDLARAKGIVFDLRGYPKIWTDPLAHLIEAPIECAQWLVPEPLLPDRKATTFDKSSWQVMPKAPRFAAKVAFLTDGRAVSAAETYLGLVEHHELAPIVGEPTAGTNGNVNPFVLPGGYHVSWTGMKVLKQDGSRHHGVGILPTVPCSRTMAGVAEGRDEQLEKALEIVRD